MTISIIPYTELYDDGIRALEQMVFQGKNMQLEIIKDHFLDRAVIFNKYHACLAVDVKGKAIGTLIGAQTHMIVNGEKFDAGVGYDVKVHPACRNRGIGKLLTKYIYRQFFKPELLSRNFATLKRSNSPVPRLLLHAVPGLWLYDFVYLTIPVNARIRIPAINKDDKSLFSVTLFDKETLSPSYYTSHGNGLGYFHTYKMYRLKIRKIGFLLRMGMKFLQIAQPEKYRRLPSHDTELRFATLYGHNEETICGINDVMEQLEPAGVNYLLVCCRKNDAIFQMLKKHSINTYAYYIMSDFMLTKKDKVTIDVRCL